MTAGDVYRALWRHKFFIVVLTAAFVGATLYATSRQTRTYEASTLVRVQERGDVGSASAALLAAQTLTQTYANIIGSGALKGEIRTLVAECIRQSSVPTRVQPAGLCESLGRTSGGRLAPRKVSEVAVSGSPVQDLDLLSISARSRSPTNAMIAANAVPWAMRAFIRKTGSRSERLVTVKPATMPTSPVSRQLPLKIAIAVMLGLIFNGALALLLELFRDRLPEPDELGQILGNPVLATIPMLRLHEAATLTTTPQEPRAAVGREESLAGEGNARMTSQREGPKR